MKFVAKAKKYFSKHVWYVGFIHLWIGVGIGILITNPFVGEHPVRWAAAFILTGLAGHLVAFF